jgi:hypothetical protein
MSLLSATPTATPWLQVLPDTGTYLPGTAVVIEPAQ